MKLSSPRYIYLINKRKQANHNDTTTVVHAAAYIYGIFIIEICSCYLANKLHILLVLRECVHCWLLVVWQIVDR